VGTTTATLALCLAACGATPSTKVADDQVDLIEINHFHDDQGRPVFDQILFYDWSAADQRYQLRDWRLLKSQNQLPLRNTGGGEYVAVWSDFKSRDVLRRTKAKLVRESWTQYDPELVEREFLPEGKRRKLSPVQEHQLTPSYSEPRAASATLRPLQNPSPR
jgi:hypothetical protein